MVSHTELMEHLPTLVRYRDAPVSEPADIPIYLLSREAPRSVKMILTGEGSDELLGGYPKHSVERFTSAYQILPGLVRHGVRGGAAPAAGGDRVPGRGEMLPGVRGDLGRAGAGRGDRAVQYGPVPAG